MGKQPENRTWVQCHPCRGSGEITQSYNMHGRAVKSTCPQCGGAGGKWQ